jgi:hypothetical protein
MRKPVLAVLLASLAAYFFGFLFWGATTAPYSAWKKAPDDVAAGEALLRHFPESGTYYVPSTTAHPPARLEELFQKGPVGFVHIDRDGRPLHDGSTMAWGFVQTAVTMALLALVLARVRRSLPSYGARVGFVALLALTAAMMYEGGEIVWWQLPAAWELVQAAYNVGAWIVGGAVLARFVRADA